MIDRDYRISDPVIDLGIGLDLSRAPAPAREMHPSKAGVRHPGRGETPPQGCEIGRFGEEIVYDPHRLGGIGRAQYDLALAARMQQHRIDTECVFISRCHTGKPGPWVERRRGEQEFDVRRLQLRPGPEECVQTQRQRGRRPCPEQPGLGHGNARCDRPASTAETVRDPAAAIAARPSGDRAGSGRPANRPEAQCPCSRRCAAGPMPDSINNCGELKTPPHRMTSRVASTWTWCLDERSPRRVARVPRIVTRVTHALGS